MKKFILTLLTLCLLCCITVSVSAASDVVQGDMGTLNWEFEADLELTGAGQSTEYEMPAETYLMALNISEQLDGEVLYISAHDGVELMVNAKTQQPVDGWYCLDVATLPGHQVSIVNWNMNAVTLTAKVPAPQPELFEIDVARMILGNALEFQFGVAQTKIPDTTGFYALIEKTWADGSITTKTVPATDWGTAGTYHAIVYDGLAAKEMADVFYVTIYNGDGVQVSYTRTDAVRDYVERAYAGQKTTGKTMMVDMLCYGAAAQAHFSYNTADPANNKLTAEQLAVGTVATPEITNGLVKGTNYLGTRFILESRIQVQVAFKNMTDDMYAVYTFTDNYDRLQQVRVEGADFITAGNMKGIELNALVYADARADVTITVYNADGTVYGSAVDGIESCSARSTKGDDVFVALMKFADSARKHLYNK